MSATKPPQSATKPPQLPKGAAESPAAELRQDLKTTTPALPAEGPLDLDFLLDADVDGWKPRNGDKLVGRILSIDEGGQDSQFGSYPLLLIRRDSDGKLVNVHAFHTVLRTELGRRSVGVGDRIGIKYLGMAEGGDFSNYENYKVMVDRPAGDRLSVATAKRGQPNHS